MGRLRLSDMVRLRSLVAIVERSGPKIIAELHGRTIGAYHAHFGTIAASMVLSHLARRGSLAAPYRLAKLLTLLIPSPAAKQVMNSKNG